MTVRRAVTIRNLRLLSASLDSAAYTQLSSAFAAEFAHNVSKLGSMQSQQLISLHSALHTQPARSFASSTITQQAEPAESVPVEGSDPSHIPQYERLDDPITGPYPISKKAVFAVVEVGGTQYKVTPDDLIYVEKLDGIDINDKLRLGRVLLLGSAAETVIGRPYIPGAGVIAAVEEQVLDGKVIIFKKRRRKNSRRTKGHRQPLTGLRILEVEGIEEASPVATA